MTSESICGKCGAPIPIESDSCPQCSPAPQKRSEVIPAFLIVAVLCSSFLMLGSSVVNVTTIPTVKVEKSEPKSAGDLKMSAFLAAKQFVEERYPGRKQFSELYQSSIEQKGKVFIVTLSADEMEGTSPRRYFFTVEMEYSGNAWALKQINR